MGSSVFFPCHQAPKDWTWERIATLADDFLANQRILHFPASTALAVTHPNWEPST
jgi:hypothetical protein